MAIAASQISRLLTSLRGGASTEDNSRGSRRVTIVTRGIARVVVDGREQRFSVLTRDISVTGLGLIAAAPIQRGLEIRVELSDGVGEVITLTGTVRYSRSIADGLWGIGVEFARSA